MTRFGLLAVAIALVPTEAYAFGPLPFCGPLAPPPEAQPPPEPPPPVDPGQELLDEDAPPIDEMPPPPGTGSPPPVETIVERPTFIKPPPVPSLRRTALHLGMAYGLEVARDGASSFAMGGGAQLGVELFWPQIAFELAVAVEAHGDTTTMPDHGFWEAHPMAYVKKPFKDGVWEAFAGYGASFASMHAGDFAEGQYVHVIEAGFEDRTAWMYSRLFVRWYAPFDGDLFGASTAIVGASVGLFHLSKKKE